MIAKNSKIKREGKGQEIFFSLFIAFLVISGIAFLAVSNYRIKEKRSEMIGRIEDLKKQIAVLEEQNSNLRTGISQATSSAYQEEKMREQGYQRPGENNIVVVPPEQKPEAEPAGEQATWWQKLLAKISFFMRE